MSLPLEAGAWTVDPVHSVVQFAVRHLGISTLRGRFADVDAALTVGDSLEASSLSATVGMGSIDTGNPDRDGHVRSSDFFDADANPKMTFTSTAIEAGSGGDYTVTGDLTLNGQTKSTTLQVDFFGTEANPLDGSTRAGFEARGKIDRTDFGIDWNVPLASGGIMLGKEIDIVIDAQLVGPAAE
ncbi:MAG: YceI family protein [Acidimicrobiales bacterium]